LKHNIISELRYWQEIVKVCKLNFYVISTALKYIVLLWDISRYRKNKIKGGPLYVVSAIFFIKINKGEIRTANPTLSANAKRFNL
jgi:hypothetical protein